MSGALLRQALGRIPRASLSMVRHAASSSAAASKPASPAVVSLEVPRSNVILHCVPESEAGNAVNFLRGRENIEKFLATILADEKGLTTPVLVEDADGKTKPLVLSLSDAKQDSPVQAGGNAVHSVVNLSVAEKKAIMEDTQKRTDQLLLHLFVRGSKDLLSAFSNPVTEAELDRERRYLHPCMLISTTPEVRHRKVDFASLPASHPARDVTAKPASAGHFTGHPQFFDAITDLDALLRKLDALEKEQASAEKLAKLQEEELAFLSKLDDADAEQVAASGAAASGAAPSDAEVEAVLGDVPEEIPAVVDDILKKKKKAPISAQVDLTLFDRGVTWLKRNEMEVVLNTQLKVSQYREILSRLQALWAHPMADTIKHSHLLRFVRMGGIIQRQRLQNKIAMTNQESARAIGRRKASVAQVLVKRGSGNVTINNREVADYFQSDRDRLDVLKPLLAMDRLEHFDVVAKVSGGGLTGHVGAVRLGIARCLTSLDSSARKVMRDNGLLTRDSRVVERKKPGQRKARRKFQWVKR